MIVYVQADSILRLIEVYIYIYIAGTYLWFIVHCKQLILFKVVNVRQLYLILSLPSVRTVWLSPIMNTLHKYIALNQ